MSVETLGRRTMAGKPKGRPRTSERDDITVRLDREVADMGRQVAAARGVSLAELLSDMLRQPMTEAFLGVVKDLEAKVRGMRHPKSGPKS